VRFADLERDGWALDDGEARQARSPATFTIPPVEIRSNLLPGDLAQLIFVLAVEGEDEPETERMWVLVRQRVEDGYLGLLDNEPASISENDDFWVGSEIPFEVRHIIDARPRTRATMKLAKEPPRRRWTD
jgi:hypothetical protein